MEIRLVQAQSLAETLHLLAEMLFLRKFREIASFSKKSLTYYVVFYRDFRRKQLRVDFLEEIQVQIDLYLENWW